MKEIFDPVFKFFIAIGVLVLIWDFIVIACRIVVWFSTMKIYPFGW